jgi:hypothetical protein
MSLGFGSAGIAAGSTVAALQSLGATGGTPGLVVVGTLGVVAATGVLVGGLVSQAIDASKNRIGDVSHRSRPEAGKPCIGTEEWEWKVHFYVFDTWELAVEAMKRGGACSRVLFDADRRDTGWREGFNADHAAHHIRREFYAC